MVPPTRRRALHGATALVAALAGCGGSTTSVSRSSGPESDENVDRDPDSFTLRNAENGPPAWLPDPDEEETPWPGDRPWARGRTRVLIASRESLARLEFADVPGVEDARAFAEATDLSRATLLLDAHRVGACFTLELCAVAWSATRYHTFLSRQYRDADVACSTDAREGLAFLVRIPAVLDPTEVRGSGSATTSGTCEGWVDRMRARRAAARERGGDA